MNISFTFILKLITKIAHFDSLWKRNWGEFGNGQLRARQFPCQELWLTVNIACDEGYRQVKVMNWPPDYTRELKQPRLRRQQKPHKFAYLTMKKSVFARFARAFSIFWHFVDVLVLSTTWNDLFCCCVDDVSIWWQMFNFVFLCPKRWFQFNSRIVRTQFSSLMSLNNWKMITETRGHIFRGRSRFRRRRVCLSSLLYKKTTTVT